MSDGAPGGAAAGDDSSRRPPRRPTRRTGVFISYRRDDASGFAGRLHGSLSNRFGRERIFRDIDTLEPGADFGLVIEQSLSSCGALVAVIGREWIVDSSGRRRLDEPGDWVRLEVAAALERGDIAVIPVLVEGVRMPSPDDLPEQLALLPRINAMELSDSRWDYDVDRLVRRLEAAVGPPKRRWPARLRRRLVPRSPAGFAARLAVVAAVALVAVQLGRAVVGPAPVPARMGGDFNIAVAGFGAVDRAGKPVASATADDLARRIYERLGDELGALTREGFTIDARSPARTGPLRGATAERRAAAAAELAGRIGADVVVYGTLDLGDPGGFRPEFFVSEATLPGAEELFGQYELGSLVEAAGDLERNKVVLKDMREQVLGRTRALAEFIVGLSYLSAGQPQPARTHFEAARTAPGWDDRDGKEVLYLLLGTAAANTGDLDAAQAAYDRALVLEPEYARARLGQAEILFQRSRADCESTTVAADGLQRSAAMFRGSLDAGVRPALSDVPLKALFGQARVHLCLSQALVADRFADAEAGFSKVIEAYEKGNRRIRELAAESHANLGLVHLPAVGDADADARYRRAEADYARAVDVTADRSRKAFFSSMRGFILGRLGERARAEDAYGQAIALEPDAAKRAGYEQSRAQLGQPVRSP